MIVKAMTDKTNVLGRIGENNAVVMVFDISRIAKEYQSANYEVLNKRPNDPAAYSVPDENYTVTGNELRWTLKSSDLAYRGVGNCEVVAKQDGAIVKTEIYTTQILNALDGSENPPDPWKSWVDGVKEDADRAEAAAALLESATAVATTLEPDSQATASYSEGVFSFGIPKGDQGEQGEPGVETQLVGTLINGNKYQLSIERV